MIRLKLSSQRRVLTLLLATALATTGAFATTGGIAAAAPTTKVPLTSAQMVQYEKLASWLGSIQDGQTASTTLSSGYTLTASRVHGQKLITVTSSKSKLGTPPKAGATPNSICTWIVTAAIYGMGAAVFAAAAFFGFPIVVFGFVITPWMSGAIAVALTFGGSVYAIVGAFLC